MEHLKKRFFILALILVAILVFNIFGYTYISKKNEQNAAGEEAQHLLSINSSTADDVVQYMIVLSIHQTFNHEQYISKLKELRVVLEDYKREHLGLTSFIDLSDNPPYEDSLQRALNRYWASFKEISSKADQIANDSTGPHAMDYAQVGALRALASLHQKNTRGVERALSTSEKRTEANIGLMNRIIIFSLIGALVLVFVFVLVPVISQNIRGREQLQKSISDIKRSESLLRALIQASPDLIFVQDKHQRYKMTNAAFAEMTGLNAKQVQGKSDRDLGIRQSEDNQTGLWIGNETVIETGEPRHIPEAVLQIGGRERVVSITKMPLKDDQGEVWGIMGFAHDLSDRIIAEKRIQESEVKYRYLFNTMPIPMWIYDLETLRFLEVNERALQNYGYTREEFAAMTIFDVRPDDEFDKLKGVLDQPGAQRPIRFRGTWTHKKKDGEKIFVDIISHRIDFMGRQAIMVLANDITRQVELRNRLMEEKVNHQKEIAKAIIHTQERERSEIGQELHDNVNQILTTVKLYIENIRSYPDHRDHFTDKGIELTQRAINEIRFLSRQLVTPVLRDLGFRETIAELIEHYRSLNLFAIDFEYDLDDNDLDKEMQLTIYRIIQEQMNNIVKYANAAHLTVSITGGGDVVLHIKDDGVGFDPKLVTRGLGLENIRNRAVVYHGRLDLDAAPGKGCSMKIRFPAAVGI